MEVIDPIEEENDGGNRQNDWIEEADEPLCLGLENGQRRLL
jgi:hypothetical protein